MKRGLILIVLLLLLRISSAQALTIISDIDDTLKVSNTANPIGTAAHALTRIAFTGMAETFQALDAINTDENPHQVQFIYLSARPDILNDTTEQFLNLHQFPQGELVLKGKKDPNSIQEYKTTKIRKLISQSRDEFILVGDDTQADPETYLTIAEAFPSQIKGAYIHEVTGRSTPPKLTRYLIAYDLAANFRKLGLINDAQLESVSHAILNEPKTDRILPRFQACPQFYESEDQRVAKLIRKICDDRFKIARD